MKRFLFILSILFLVSTGFIYAQNSIHRPGIALSDNEDFRNLKFNDEWKDSFLKSLDRLLDSSLIPAETFKLVMKYLADELPPDPLKAAYAFADTVKKADYALRLGLMPAEVGIKARYSFKANRRKNIVGNSQAKKNVQSLHVQSVKNRIKHKQSNNPDKTKEPEHAGGRIQ